MRALLHVHSDWSYDGESTLAGLAAWGHARRLDAILLTEHVNDFDQDKMERYVAEVDGLSHLPCRLVPGLEFAVRGGFHILGLNLRTFMKMVDPVGAVRYIREHGGIAVLAHPARYAGRWPEDEVLRELHGIEVWNARYDGRFLPPVDLIETSREVCSRFEHLHMFGGQDLHRPSGQRLVASETRDGAGVPDLIADLERGAVRFGAPGFRLAARLDEAPRLGAPVRLGHRCYLAARRLRDRWSG